MATTTMSRTLMMMQQRMTVLLRIPGQLPTCSVVGAAAVVTTSIDAWATAAAPVSWTKRYLSITYSGGQAIEGQGGYYGSGGARVLPVDHADHSATQAERSKMLALASDVEKIQSVMHELERLESLLLTEAKSSNTATITGKSMELKSQIKKLMTAPEVSEALNRLEIQGEPVWGLSSREREMIILAREKVNEC